MRSILRMIMYLWKKLLLPSTSYQSHCLNREGMVDCVDGRSGDVDDVIVGV